MGIFYDIITKQGYYEVLMNGKAHESSNNSTETDKNTKE